METSGLDDLMEAFQEADQGAPAADPAPAPEQTTASAEAAPAETTEAPPAEDTGQPAAAISRDDVRAIVAEGLQTAAQREQAAAQARTQAAMAASMTDADYGRATRMREAQAQVYGQAAQQAAVQIFGQLWSQVTSLLKREGVPESSWPDPQKFNQFEDLLAAVGETVSDRRADKKAEKLAATKAEAIVADKWARLTKDLPVSPALVGGLPPGDDLPDNAPGFDWLVAGLMEMDRK